MDGVCFSDEKKVFQELSEKFAAHNQQIRDSEFERYSVRRGLRNPDGTGVMAGLTKICAVMFYAALFSSRHEYTDGGILKISSLPRMTFFVHSLYNYEFN